jgi:hypothetical protein
MKTTKLKFRMYWKIDKNQRLIEQFYQSRAVGHVSKKYNWLNNKNNNFSGKEDEIKSLQNKLVNVINLDTELVNIKIFSGWIA